MKTKVYLILCLFIFLAPAVNAQGTRKVSRAGVKAEPTSKVWTAEKANAWYNEHNWITGANFIPSTAINQLEMWQQDSFDPETIDRELGYAASIGFNTMRVFLHSIVWQQFCRI